MPFMARALTGHQNKLTSITYYLLIIAVPLIIMNPFEEFTVIVGLAAIAFEGFSYLRAYIQKLLH